MDEDEQLKFFVGWLEAQMEARGIDGAKLSTLAHVQPGSISNIRRMKRVPGVDVSLKLARALKIDPVVFFRIAGLLPEESFDSAVVVDEITIKAKMLTPAEQDEILAMINYKLGRIKDHPPEFD